jgi:hypothetical protein
VKKIIWLILIIDLVGCHNPPDFKMIKPGMRSSEAIKLVGVPYRRQQVGGVDWWLYNDSAQHIVVVDHDTVANCTTQRQAIEIMTHALKSIDSLRKK